jgi:dephospho-CoA kinase
VCEMGARKKVIAMSGMPGAGKGVASNAGKRIGLEVFVLGDVVREETERRGLEPTPQNVGNVMLDIRAKEGPNVVARRLLPKIEQAKSSVVIVEGIRSLHELNELRSKFEVIPLAIHASPKSRFQRLISRNRSDDPKTWEVFQERDFRELDVGLGHVLALADIVLINEGSISQLQLAFNEAFAKLNLQ